MTMFRYPPPAQKSGKQRSLFCAATNADARTNNAWMLQLAKNGFRVFVNLLYPPLCLHCRQLAPHHPMLCSDCQQLLDLIDCQGRCPRCFKENSDADGYCQHCARESSLFNGYAAAFEYEGPAATLVKQLKYANMPYLSKGLAAAVAVQCVQLRWPVPDVIVPVPIPWNRLLQRGYNQSALISRDLSAYLQVPTKEVLRRSAGDFSQAGLNRQQRKRLDASRFFLREKSAIKGSVVLLIDDVATTGTTLNVCGEALLNAQPKSLYAMTVCRALSHR